MSFESPEFALGFLLLPLALLAYWRVQRRRPRDAVRFTNLDLLAGLVKDSSGWRRHLPPALYLLALAALLVALLRPQSTVAVSRDEESVMLVTDVSGSMRAKDVKPTRLAAAKQAAHAFLDQVPGGVRVGIASFSHVAQILEAPTADRKRVGRAIDSLSARGGTAMGEGLAQGLAAAQGGGGAARALPASPPSAVPPSLAPTAPAAGLNEPRRRRGSPAAVVLLSDGTSTSGSIQPLIAAQQARAAGVPVYTIALGTRTGVVERTVRDGAKRTIAVPPDTGTLRQIANLTGGRQFEAPSEDALREIYESLGTRIGTRDERRELTAAFAAGGLVLLLAGGGLSLMWFSRFP
jgi:Ca-activated chloride channel homolog